MSHEAHVKRHLEQVRASHGAAKARAIVERSRLAGRPGVNCAEYISAVRAVLGEAASRFAKVNFILAGCDALDDETRRTE